MAIWIVKNSGKTSYGIKRYLCDTEEDLPYNENGEAVAPGSKAYVISDKATFMMGSNGEWYQIQEGSGSGGASSMSELTDVDLTGLDDGKILKYNEATQTWITSDASASMVDLTQEEYDELPSDAKNLSLIYQISDKGYFFYKGKQFRASKELTQEEYDQLSPEEQNNGTEYLITDATTSISDIDDVSISGATDGQGLYYDATLGVWKNSAGKIVYAEIDGTLTAGQDTIVLSSNYITTDSVVDPFVSSAFDGVTYTSMTIANGSVTLVFPVQATDMPVMVRVWIDGYGAANNIEIDDDHALPDQVWSGEKIQEEITNIYSQLAELYDNTATYNVGDTVIYNNNYYENITQIVVPEDFDPAKWEQIDFETRLGEKIDNNEFADDYSEIETYQEGDVVVYDNKFYINTTPISAPGEAWNPDHWQPVVLSDLIPTVEDKMDKVNPVGSGSFSLNRKANTTIGTNSFAEGQNTTASGRNAHAEGYNTTASGDYSHSEGFNTTVSNFSSHAEGQGTTASGYTSHAEGISTTASHSYSHAEGQNTIASGEASHAEGRYTTASGEASHAEGNSTVANHRSQHVFGEYNTLDNSSAEATKRGTYVEIVGNGTGFGPNIRSNARTLDWQGNEVLAGDLTINGSTSVGDALSAIGETISVVMRSISIPNKTWTHCSSIPLSKGKYIIIGAVEFDNNATGARSICISSNSTADEGSIGSRVCVSSTPGLSTKLQTVYFIETISNSTTLYLNAYQSSGGNLLVTYSSFTPIRLA